jgi:putative acetyltransferase
MEDAAQARQPAEGSTNVTIRAFRMDDWQDVAELWQQPQVIWGTRQLPYQSLDDVRKRLENPPERFHRLVAVTGDGRAIGLLGLQVGQGRVAHVGHIGMMVHPDFHNQGVGSALMEAAIDLANKWLNLTRLDLEVYTDNAAAIHLYEKHGFEIEGTKRRYAFRDGEYVDSYMMARVRE